jgi:hypothetical protein
VVAGQSSSSTTDGVSRWVLASIICAASFALGACSSGGDLPERAPDPGPPAPSEPGTLRLPFLVDDYYVPNGCFGDANCGAGVLDIDSRACRDRVPTAQSVCRRFRYVPLAPDAAGYAGHLGILFQDVGPEGEVEIGRVPGLPVQAGAQRVTFWAAVGAGNVEVSFRAGGANNWEGQTNPNLPYRDDFGVGNDVVLDTRFQRVEIDLNGVSYEDVVSPFGWSIESKGAVEPIDLFIDDWRWQ